MADILIKDINGEADAATYTPLERVEYLETIEVTSVGGPQSLVGFYDRDTSGEQILFTNSGALSTFLWRHRDHPTTTFAMFPPPAGTPVTQYFWVLLEDDGTGEWTYGPGGYFEGTIPSPLIITKPTLPGDTPEGDGWGTSELFGPGGGVEPLNTVGTYVTKLECDNADLVKDEGIGNAVYLSLFSGTHWAEDLKYSSERTGATEDFERLLSETITIGTVKDIKQSATTALQWLESTGVVDSLEVNVRNPSVGLIEIDILATEPNSGSNRYKLLWDQATQSVTAVYRNS